MKLCVQVCTHNMRHDRDDVVVQSDSDDVISSGQDSEMKFSSVNGTCHMVFVCTTLCRKLCFTPASDHRELIYLLVSELGQQHVKRALVALFAIGE